MVARQSLHQLAVFFHFCNITREKDCAPSSLFHSPRHFQMSTNPVTGRDMFTLIGGVKDNQFLSLHSGAVACSEWPSVEQKELLVLFSVLTAFTPIRTFRPKPLHVTCLCFSLVSQFCVIWNGEVLVFIRKGQFQFFYFLLLCPEPRVPPYLRCATITCSARGCLPCLEIRHGTFIILHVGFCIQNGAVRFRPSLSNACMHR